MKKLRDFRCSKGHVTELLVDDETKQVRCDCGEESKRIITPITFTLEGYSGHFPTAADKWTREHEKRGHQP